MDREATMVLPGTPAPHADGPRMVMPRVQEPPIHGEPAAWTITGGELRRWFARAGYGVWIYEVGADPNHMATFGLGRRFGNDGWFLEGQLSASKAEVEVPFSDANPVLVDDRGEIFYYTLNLGREFDIGTDDRFRWRVHAGLGWHDMNSLTLNGAGYATTVGGAFQARVWRDVWGQLGVAHYGLNTKMARDTQEYRHNLAIDISLVIDF